MLASLVNRNHSKKRGIKNKRELIVDSKPDIVQTYKEDTSSGDCLLISPSSQIVYLLSSLVFVTYPLEL